ERKSTGRDSGPGQTALDVLGVRDHPRGTRGRPRERTRVSETRSATADEHASELQSRKRRHTRSLRDWSSDVCSSDLIGRAHVLSSDKQKTDTRSLRDWSSDVCSSD